jgi:uncharacterized protein
MPLFNLFNLFISCIVCFTLCGQVYAEELTAEKKADIQQLMEMTNVLALGKQMNTAIIENLTKSLKVTRPDIPQEVLELLPGEVTAVFNENLHIYLQEMIPLYHKYFTAAEIKEMMRFYSSDLGKKTIRVMPELMQDSMVVGERWGRMLTPIIQLRIAAKLRQQGIKI